MRSGKNRLLIVNKPWKKPPVLSEGSPVNNTTELKPPQAPISTLFPFLKDSMAAIYTISDDASALPSPIVPIKRSSAPEVSGVRTSHQMILAAKQVPKLTPLNHGNPVFSKTTETVAQIHRSSATIKDNLHLLSPTHAPAQTPVAISPSAVNSVKQPVLSLHTN
ncbi:hypothetical protein NDU88_002767 [Pleurodeles waltl]|uniref:Uncharacterized protein n=1 Tax=Pleurodeles waltl TaxID=8319 RepID=A0AAV7M1M7_PLEWA|nr:hypothetical protein NDU88_002767 [Pleurodeles waltl]